MILFGSNVDTELLAVRSVADALPDEVGGVRWFHPDRVDGLPPLDGIDSVVVRLLGGRESWREPFDELRDECVRRGIHLVAAGGEEHPDAELVAASTVPAGTAHEVHRYLAAGGPSNVAQLLHFLSDTLQMTGLGFDPPEVVAQVGIWTDAGVGAAPEDRDPTRPFAAVIFYRAHLVAGNVSYVSDLCRALDRAGVDSVAIWTYSLRPDADGRVLALERCRELGVDVVVTSTLAAGSSEDGGEAWSVVGIDELGVPVIQSPASSRSREEWLANDAGLAPLDVATGIAIPSSTAASSGRPSRSRKSSRRPSTATSSPPGPTRSARPRSPRSSPGPPGSGTDRSPTGASPSSSPPTRRSAPAWATPSGSTRRRRPSICCTPCARWATRSTACRPMATP